MFETDTMNFIGITVTIFQGHGVLSHTERFTTKKMSFIILLLIWAEWGQQCIIRDTGQYSEASEHI